MNEIDTENKLTKNVYKGYTFRIYPNEEQKKKIQETINACNYVYNGILAYRQHRYRDFGEKYSVFDLNKKLAEIKKADTWLSQWDSKAYYLAIKKMDIAYSGWLKQLKQKGVKYSKKTLARCARKEISPQIWMAEKYPKFKGKNNPVKSYSTYQLNVADGKINLPKIGKMKISLYGKMKKDFYVSKECTITKSPTNKYYASILVEEEITLYPNTGRYVGIDLGIEKFATTSDNQQYHLPKEIWKNDNKIKELQRKLARQKKGSARYEKTRILIAKKHEKLANIRSNALHNISTEIIKEYDVVALEDLKIKQMQKNKMYSRLIGKCGFSSFRTILEYKAKWHDKEIRVIDQFYPSTKTCSQCGNVRESISIKERVYVCKECGLSIDRDYNASINILSVAISNLIKL